MAWNKQGLIFNNWVTLNTLYLEGVKYECHSKPNSYYYKFNFFAKNQIMNQGLIIVEIGLHLDPASLLSYQLTNRFIFKLVATDYFWCCKLKLDYGVASSPAKHTYQKLFLGTHIYLLQFGLLDVGSYQQKLINLHRPLLLEDLPNYGSIDVYHYVYPMFQFVRCGVLTQELHQEILCEEEKSSCYVFVWSHKKEMPGFSEPGSIFSEHDLNSLSVRRKIVFVSSK